MAALEGSAAFGSVIDQKGRFQYILAVLQFHVVMVDKAVNAAEVIGVLIDQHASIELGRKLIGKERKIRSTHTLEHTKCMHITSKFTLNVTVPAWCIECCSYRTEHDKNYVFESVVRK